MSQISLILKKLEEIEKKIRNLEAKRVSQDIDSESDKFEDQKNPDLLMKAIQVIKDYEEISAPNLAKILKISTHEAEKIMDWLEKAGLGECQWREK